MTTLTGDDFEDATYSDRSDIRDERKSDSFIKEKNRHYINKFTNREINNRSESPSDL